MPSRFNVDRTNYIGVFFEATLNALKTRLRGAIIRTDVLAFWAGLTGVVSGKGMEIL